MERSFRASILGLGCTDVVSIRQHIHDVLVMDADVEWVPANQDDLDFLVVNSSFINSNSIQSLLKRKPMPVLLVNHHSMSEGQQQDVLSLPLSEHSKVKQWIRDYVIDKKSLSTAAFSAQNTYSLASEDLSVLEALRNPAHRIVQVFDSRGTIGVVDTVKGVLRLVPERRGRIELDGSWRFEPVYTMPAWPVSLDLVQWLWEMAWSSQQCATLLDVQQPLRLLSWPQPSNADRKEVLSMSAYLAKDQMNAVQLAAASQVSLGRAQHFLSALLASGCGVKVQSSSYAAATLPSPEQRPASGFRRLLSSLRSHLGI